MTRLRSCLCLGLLLVSSGATLPAQTSGAQVALEIHTLSGESHQLGNSDFQNRVHVRATGHDGVQHDFEGIDLRSLLTKLGSPRAGTCAGRKWAIMSWPKGQTATGQSSLSRNWTPILEGRKY